MEERLMKKKKILMLVCMAVLAVTVVIPVNAAKKTNKKQIQVLNLYQDQKTDIEEEYLVSYLEDKNIDEESVEKQEKEEWYIDIKTGKITKDSQYKRHFYNDGWTIEFKDDKGKILYSTEDEEDEGGYIVLHEFNKDKFLVVERLESIDERSIYLGFMNAKGKWKQDPWKVDNDLLGSGYKGDELFQLGKGIVGFCIKNTGTIQIKYFQYLMYGQKICIIVAGKWYIRYGRHHVHMRFVWLIVREMSPNFMKKELIY